MGRKTETPAVVCPPGWKKLDTPHGETYRRTVFGITVGVTRDGFGAWIIFGEDLDALGIESDDPAANQLRARDAAGAMREANRRVIDRLRGMTAAWECGAA